MRKITPPKRPWGWQTHVLKKGKDWLKIGRNKNKNRPSPFWLAYRKEIRTAFNHICCYTVAYVPNGQVEHFIPWKNLRNIRKATLAYEWTNIRYSDGWINQSKKDRKFPDPFTIENDWFELNLPSLQLQATGNHPQSQSEAINNLLQRVSNDERVMEMRQFLFKEYKYHNCTLIHVDNMLPLLGRALRINSRYLNSEDQMKLQNGTLPSAP